MEISAWDIYLLTRLKSINIILLLAAALPMIGVILVAANCQGEPDEKDLACAKQLIIMSVIAALLWVFTPNEKEAAAMYVLPKLVKMEAAQNLPKDIANLVHDWAEELSARTKK